MSEPLREDGDAELGDVVEDRSAESPFEVAATSLLPEEINRLLSPLDEREREILHLVAEGRSNREIACELYVTLKAIEGHLAHAYAKLGIRGRDQLPRALGSRKD